MVDLSDINQMSLQEAALAYATLRIRVLPLRPERKDPLPGSHGVKEATCEVGQVKQWWNEDPTRNIGITVPGTILDIDARHGGWDTWATLLNTFGQSIMSSTKQITPTDGMHVFYAPSDPVVALAGIDVIRPGKYVVATPSVHPLGGRYQWNEAASVKTKLPEIPVPLIQRVHKTEGPTERHGEGYALAALRHEVEAVRGAAPGTRNNTLSIAAYKLARFIQTRELTERDIADHLLAAAMAAGLPEIETKKTILSALKATRPDD